MMSEKEMELSMNLTAVEQEMKRLEIERDRAIAQKDVAYNERNLLALLLAKRSNDYLRLAFQGHPHRTQLSGWYTHGQWDGYSRVISIDGGSINFHVPDDFDMGDIPEIKPNWNGHTTEEKWKLVGRICNQKESSN